MPPKKAATQTPTGQTRTDCLPKTDVDNLTEQLQRVSLGGGFKCSLQEGTKCREITASDPNIHETIEENQENQKPYSKTSLLIAHWNIRGIGDHCWDTSALFCLVNVLKVDVILLSEIKSLQLKDLPYMKAHFHWICLPPLHGYQRTRGLYIAYRKELSSSILLINGDDSEHHKHKDKVSIEFLSMDFLLSNGIHRVIIAYHEPNGNAKCPVDVKELLESELYPDGTEKRFVHLMGDLNFPHKSDRERLDVLLGDKYKHLLNTSWKTHGDNQLDLMYSSGPDDTRLNTSVYAHYPVDPYKDLVQRIRTSESGSTKMELVTTENGEEGAKLTIQGEPCPKSAKTKKAPEGIHKILLLHAGDKIRHGNALNYHCSASRACFYCDPSSKKINWYAENHTKYEINSMDKM